MPWLTPNPALTQPAPIAQPIWPLAIAPSHSKAPFEFSDGNLGVVMEFEPADYRTPQCLAASEGEWNGEWQDKLEDKWLVSKMASIVLEAEDDLDDDDEDLLDEDEEDEDDFDLDDDEDEEDDLDDEDEDEEDEDDFDLDDDDDDDDELDDEEERYFFGDDD